jgi:hypothetical protein
VSTKPKNAKRTGDARLAGTRLTLTNRTQVDRGGEEKGARARIARNFPKMLGSQDEQKKSSEKTRNHKFEITESFCIYFSPSALRLCG